MIGALGRGLFSLGVFVYAVCIIGFVVLLKDEHVTELLRNPLIAGYSIAVALYLTTRLALSMFYRPAPRVLDILPTIAVVIPAMNEEDGIGSTIDAIFELDYDPDKLSVFCVDDGSTDDTWERIVDAGRRHPRLEAIRFSRNRGKRAAMAAGIRATDAEIVCFVDSDSALRRDAMVEIVQPFADRRIACVTGHADVQNRGTNLLTRMQQVRYFAAFRVIKAAESLFGAVTCASGCFSAYRRSRVLRVLDRWENQTFLGQEATFGDDRAMTNYLLRTHRVVYQSSAVCETIVPDTLGRFCRQQVRWKKSWTRESIAVAKFAWDLHPAAAASIYASIAFQLIGPLIAGYALLWRPLVDGASPWEYVIGLYAMAMLYSLYYAWQRQSPHWWAGVLFVALYSTVMIWQTYWAIATSRRTGWGTRDAGETSGELTVIDTVGTPNPCGIPMTPMKRRRMDEAA